MSKWTKRQTAAVRVGIVLCVVHILASVFFAREGQLPVPTATGVCVCSMTKHCSTAPLIFRENFGSQYVPPPRSSPPCQLVRSLIENAATVLLIVAISLI